MKKVIAILLFSALPMFSAFAEDYESYAKQDEKNWWVYVLATGGFTPYNSDNFDYTGYGVGVTLGVQLTKTFAMELAYTYNNAYEVGGAVLSYNDVKLNFLYQQHFKIADNMSLIPYAGGGLLYSIPAITAGGISIYTDEYGLDFKAGLRYKYKILLAGVGVEYDLRFIEMSALSVNFELGLIF